MKEGNGVPGASFPTEMKPSLTAEMSVEECLLKKEWLIRLCVKGSEKAKCVIIILLTKSHSILMQLFKICREEINSNT